MSPKRGEILRGENIEGREGGSSPSFAPLSPPLFFSPLSGFVRSPVSLSPGVGWHPTSLVPRASLSLSLERGGVV